ncbi:MAG: DUF3868 domain-containing protein [Muribaculaceae bacterium]|jgi:outer membrane protein OmpA-like peptidoglycan-associated protein|nr:DUF3868 domain-containing protein [Muribaculaceae bacterium]
MRRIYTTLLLILACCPVALHAENKPGYLSSIEIRQGGVVKQGRTVSLQMAVDLSKTKINTQHTVALTPVLVSADDSREVAFPPIVIDGGTRHKVYLRAQRLESVDLPPYHDDEAQVIIRRKGKEQGYDYTASVPYERWMLDGRVEIREEVHGCTNCGEGKSERQLWTGVLPPYVPEYRLDSIAPAPEPVKMRAENRTARLQFRQDSYNILPEYKDNRAELDTVSNSIMLVKNNADVKITGIYITGYASPEGSEAHNLKLSENRAKALADYIRRHDAISSDLLHVDWKGEDWEGLVRVLGDYPNLLKRDSVYAIIERYPNERDFCELQLRKLVPPTIYHRLLTELYPVLRRNEYRIEYNVRNFDLEEAKRQIETRPDLLSLSEMYKVAGSYGKGSPEYDKVMAVAVRYFPTSPAALNENALSAIAREEYDAAIELLEKSETAAQTAELLNTLGVAYAKAGQYDKAEDAFRRAAEAGSETARHNLEEVRQVMDQL